MNYATIKPRDIANGPGIRVSLFVSGCRHHCKGCFNPETWPFTYGSEYTAETEQAILSALGKPYIRGLTLLGGEPFEPENQPTVLGLVRKARELFPEKSIWCYSGYTLERDILSGKLGETAKELAAELDVLVDGEFMLDLKNISLRFRGSENQRILDMKQTLRNGAPVLWDGTKEP
ncbi:MAG: anaerobic ribonucleoside-triphosphate reductase activating protein [Oscillospiraceae bacterium]|nr:anaerobic ribonucleoside-triphosphate reductase activating protein [Oscillospiraceae bacterium]